MIDFGRSPLVDNDFAARLTACVLNKNETRSVARFYQQRDTGMRARAGHILFQDIDTGELYWSRKITGTVSNWIMQDLHHPWCQTGFAPTKFSTGFMQRCDCPVQAVKTGERRVEYPSD